MNSSYNPPNVIAVLGPTNTGKTHYAVERMLGRSSGVIGLPLRLLAREVYDKICAIKGPAQCALITGEEKIAPEHARYYVCTVEAMPQTKRFAFAAIDEIQLMNHPERGHVFTDRLLNMRGTEETLLLGAESARPLIRELLPDARHETRERFSVLTHSGHMKLTRLPKRSVIVAFSAGEVYALAELIRRFRGGAAIVMGALSPRTRNAQAELYQSGEVDFLIATDAVGMGLNLDADHVAFASMRKFDGRRRRRLTPMEAGQIAGRAGRFRNDGTFGTTGDCLPMDSELAAHIENHNFDPIRSAEWRNTALDFNSPEALLDSLAMPAPHKRLRRVAPATDEDAFERMIQQPDIRSSSKDFRAVKRLWEICQIPDFRNLTIDTHVKLITDIYHQILSNNGKIPDEFLRSRMARLNHTEGGVDILSVRLAQIRTWTYCVNRPSWVKDTNYWVNEARAVEDTLSDALHERLTARFVDRRTSALLKGMGQNTYMETTIKDNGDVWVGEHKIGHLDGLTFKIDASGSDLEAKALQATADKAISPEVNRRLTSICAGQHAIFTLSNDGHILWGGKRIGKISNGGTIFNPDATLVGGELGDPNLKSLTEDRMRDFLRGEVANKLGCLSALKTLSASENPETKPEAKGFAYQMLENDGYIDRKQDGKLVFDLDADARRQLREVGVTFGQYDVYLRDLMKPKPALLLSLLAAYGAGGNGKPFVPFAGVTSLPNTGDHDSKLYDQTAIARAGYRACGPRIIRFDILNRLANIFRQAQVESGSRRFQIMQEMLALLGCNYEDMQGVLTDLGFKSETLEAPAAPEVSATETEVETDAPKSEPDAAAPLEAPTAEAPVEGKAESAAPPKLIKQKPKQKPLNVFHHKDTDADGNAIQRENREFWFMPYKSKRKPQARNGQKRSESQRGKNKPGQDKHSQNKSRHGKSKPDKAAQEKYRMQEQKRMEDSPFAALAALKNTTKK
ncbi:MAG: helicase-related protein [Alphaproteobacteria bacterium]